MLVGYDAPMKTREEWLMAAAKLVNSRYECEYPKFRASCGPTPGKSIGSAWRPEASGDKTAEIFISPKLDDPIEVIATLMHELVHVVVGNDAGHRGPFKELALKIGLEGRMTATTASEELKGFIEAVVSELGAYPHAQLTKLQKDKQTTRMIKCMCECGFTCRTTRKWLDTVGAPTCACGGDMKVEEK